MIARYGCLLALTLCAVFPTLADNRQDCATLDGDQAIAACSRLVAEDTKNPLARIIPRPIANAPLPSA